MAVPVEEVSQRSLKIKNKIKNKKYENSGTCGGG
jgi:hypothetical protein